MPFKVQTSRQLRKPLLCWQCHLQRKIDISVLKILGPQIGVNRKRCAKYSHKINYTVWLLVKNFLRHYQVAVVSDLPSSWLDICSFKTQKCPFCPFIRFMSFLSLWMSFSTIIHVSFLLFWRFYFYSNSFNSQWQESKVKRTK